MVLWEFDCSSWQLELTESLLAVWRLYSKQGRQSGLGIEGGVFPLNHQNPDSGVNRRAQEVFWIFFGVCSGSLLLGRESDLF